MTFFDYPIYDIPSQDKVKVISLNSDLVIVVSNKDYDDPQQILLNKILSSVNREVSQAQIELVNESEVLKFDLVNESKPTVLIFGISPRQCCLHTEMRLYHKITVAKKTFIFSHGLSELPDQVEGRRALWKILKEYYKMS